MTITKWKTDISTWGASLKIDRVECTKETAKTVWVLEVPWSMSDEVKSPVERRRNNDGNYHATWEAAHAALMADAERRLDVERQALARAQDHYGNVKGMKKPEVA